MLSKRRQILSWVEQKQIAPENIRHAMAVTGALPDTRAWYRFIERMLLGLGVLSTVTGVIFFIAYNWDALGKMGKFALTEGLLLFAFLPLIRWDVSTPVGWIALVGGSILTGGLLALFGQIYQTGADTWQLFATWGVLIFPWVWLGRFEPLWVLWIGVVNTAIVLYGALLGWGWFPFQSGGTASSLMVLGFNTAVIVIWERLRHNTPGPRIGIRFPAAAAGIAATWLGIDGIWGEGTPLGFGIWAAWLGIHCWVYRRRIRDLFMLTGGCLSALVLLVALLGKNLFPGIWNGAAFFIIALAMIVAGSVAASWLRNTARAWEEDPRD